MSAVIARVAAWLLFGAALFLTLAPAAYRPGTGVEHHLEHLFAFTLIGLMFEFGYHRRGVILALAGTALIAALEILQLWAPGRHARFSDFVMNALGLCAGVAAAALLKRMVRPQKS